MKTQIKKLLEIIEGEDYRLNGNVRAKVIQEITKDSAIVFTYNYVAEYRHDKSSNEYKLINQTCDVWGIKVFDKDWNREDLTPSEEYEITNRITNHIKE